MIRDETSKSTARAVATAGTYVLTEMKIAQPSDG
jgi:hypothetical protein